MEIKEFLDKKENQSQKENVFYFLKKYLNNDDYNLIINGFLTDPCFYIQT